MGDFLEPTGPGAGVRGDFSADGVLLARWASGFLPFFAPFLHVFDRFLPVFGPHFALFSSMSCAYLYVNNFFPVSLACRLRWVGSVVSTQRARRPALSERPARKSRLLLPGVGRNDPIGPCGENGKAFNAENAEKGADWGKGDSKRHGLQRGPEGPFLTWGERRGGLGGRKCRMQSAECGMQNADGTPAD